VFNQKKINMIVVIAAANRKGSNTLKVANQYIATLTAKNVKAKLFDLQEISSLFRDESFIALENEYLTAATKFIIISPEYNGTFSGILKLVIDNSDIKNAWHGKKVALVGVASGRAGNLRGLDHLTNVANHMRMPVLPNKLPLSSIHTLINENGQLTDEATLQLIDKQIEEFINF
jgi:chromate reductase, NAD(P)H dehydrogenase (quinone)